jgi:hypothetical protein
MAVVMAGGVACAWPPLARPAACLPRRRCLGLPTVLRLGAAPGPSSRPDPSGKLESPASLATTLSVVSW